MAKLLSYYRLCPLIDTKNLLGISEGAESGLIIVTLGRNIAIKYRVSDQKQLSSWRTKDKFSSPVYYDCKLNKYVAAFNYAYVRTWTDEDESLDKIKKYKFNQPILTIIVHNTETYVVFKTGSVYPLSEILETRKTFTPAVVAEIGQLEDITYLSSGEDLYFGFLVKSDSGLVFYWTVYTYYSKNVFSSVVLSNTTETLQGLELFVAHKIVHVLTIWGDGKVYLNELSQQKKSPASELFIVLENISAQHSIKIISLDDSHIAVYGADPNEEGAILIIYNTQFKLTQSKQIHKLYSEDARIWKMFNYILLPVGQNLVVVPFCLESEQLVALIGSHKSVQTKDDDIAFATEYELANWTAKQHKVKKKKSDKGKVQGLQVLDNRLEDLLKDGHSEADIIELVVAKIIEEKNIKLLEKSLSFFTDIPEALLVKLLKFTLTCEEKYLKKSKGGPYNNYPNELLPNTRASVLDKILVRKFSNVMLLPHLRATLTIDEAILLLQYLIYQLSEDGHDLPSLVGEECEQHLVNWISLVIDSNYQKFILSKDEKIQNLLVECKSVIVEHLAVLEDLKQLIPVLAGFKLQAEGKSLVDGKLANSLYSIEIVSY